MQTIDEYLAIQKDRDDREHFASVEYNLKPSEKLSMPCGPNCPLCGWTTLKVEGPDMVIDDTCYTNWSPTTARMQRGGTVGS